jgi:hypothetical protein
LTQRRIVFVINIHYLCKSLKNNYLHLKIKKMKKITLLLSFIACVVFAQAQLLVNENFNYTVGTGIVASKNWAGTGTSPSTTNPITVTASSITYTGYPGSGVGNEVSLANNGEDANKSFSSVITSGTIYYSALVNVTAAQAAGDYFFHIGDVPTGSTFFGRVYVKQKVGASTLAFGILKTSGGTTVKDVAYSDSTLLLNTTYLLVAKVDVTTGNSSLIINPTISSTEPTSGWLSSTVGTTALPTAGFSTVNLRQGSATLAATLKVDGIKVATSWAALFTATGFNTTSITPLSVSAKGSILTVNAVEEGSIVDIYSAVGAKVQSSKLVNGSVQINDLAKGLYVVRVGNATAKIML